jgi:outer membrane protein assembly factor BamE (lipoprotein component of BamABCDE complex)
MTIMRSYTLIPLLAAILFGGCMTASEHSRSLSSSQEREMTVGTVQRDLRKGMSQADVATALGSPNIVTRDSDGHETWIYDKAASEASYSNGGAYFTLLLVGAGSSAGASSSTQKTLTVVIKYDDRNQVDSFAYHASKF